MVVVGGGRVAARRASRLAGCGARVKVVSPAVLPGLARLAEQSRIELRLRRFRAPDVKGAFMVIAATDDREANRRAAEAARAVSALVNVADAPHESDFFLPAAFRKAGMLFTVSTGGRNPALARLARISLQKKVSSLLPGWGKAGARR